MTNVQNTARMGMAKVLLMPNNDVNDDSKFKLGY